ncbi:hypothetical protein WN944_011151 [Citrus x changshan-huyou]|uniref:Uncharacterized protein n=1 Tax=Citrus x changshan-huyou TaxID=2935761 RepID=A0AAP0QTG8_9ROSI
MINIACSPMILRVPNMAKLPETEATNGETCSKDSFKHVGVKIESEDGENNFKVWYDKNCAKTSSVWTMDNCSNSLTWVGVEILQIMYQIPRSIEMNLLESDLISEPPTGCVGFTKAMFKVGASLPLAPNI